MHGEPSTPVRHRLKSRGYTESPRRRTARSDFVERLFRENQGRVRAFAGSLMADPHAAEDVTAEVFLLMVRRAEDLPETSSGVVAWLLRATRLVAANAHRKEARAGSVMVDETIPIASTNDVEKQCLLRSTLDELVSCLSDRDRDLLIDATVLGCSHGELAAKAGVSRSTISARIARIRAVLRQTPTSVGA